MRTGRLESTNNWVLVAATKTDDCPSRAPRAAVLLLGAPSGAEPRADLSDTTGIWAPQLGQLSKRCPPAGRAWPAWVGGCVTILPARHAGQGEPNGPGRRRTSGVG